MTEMPTSRSLHRAGTWSGPPAGHVTLDYDGRFLRRKVLATDAGERILVDLEHAVSLDEGDALALEDGRMIAVQAADERLLAVSGADLARFAWHIGNRHTPCQVEPARLLIQRDHVIAGMLEGIGATLTEVTAPFTPEGGAYGHGRTHGHDHSASHTHDHSKGEDDAGHDHAHDAPQQGALHGAQNAS